MHLFRTKPVVHQETGLKRELSAFDLTMLGIGAIIGTGIFVLTGISAATQAGPAIVLSFIIAGIACGCAALCYAELAASVGGCGSAYGYGYAGLGEFPGWIIGWMLIAEYAISVSTVSVGWSGYFNNSLQSLGLTLPSALLHGPLDPVSPGFINLPAASIIVALSFLLAAGAKKSARFNGVIVAIKLVTIALFIVVAAFHVDTHNWIPFVPPQEIDAQGGTHFGWPGVVTGASIIFFAYIGFDAVSTSAEETRNPQRDLPIGIMGSLLICTVLYIVVSGLLTGIVSYRELNVPSPVAQALLMIGQNKAAGLISIGAIAGLTTVCLVLFYGLTRVLLAISRDGLLPAALGVVNPKTGSPVRIVYISGAVITALAGFVPLNKLAELTNISTLAAFVVVCAGVIMLRRNRPELHRPFLTPAYPVVPVVGMLMCLWLMLNLPRETWIAFGIWMSVGLVVYFAYSYSHSALSRPAPSRA